MSDFISIDYDGTAIIDALTRLHAGLGPQGMGAPLKEIGGVLAESTRQRFVTSTAPDGSRWAPNAQATYLGGLGSGHSGKDGRINARGTAMVMNKRPLVDTGALAEREITYQLLPNNSGVVIGTNRFAGEWDGGANVHQFGSQDGRIPARPFLGLSGEDEQQVLGILETYLLGLVDA